MRPAIAAAIFALVCAALAPSAPAQINLPAVRLPQLPNQLPLGEGANELPAVQGDAASLRRMAAQRLIRTNRQTLEADPNGAPMVRSQLVALDLSSGTLAAIAAEGFVVLNRQTLPGLDSEMFVLRAPPGMSTRRALTRLRELAPQSSVDYDHLYADSATAASAAERPESEASLAAAAAAAAVGSVRVGLIDAGVQRTHAVFQSASITPWGCDGRSVASVHGTEVASLLVGDAAPFRGAAPGAALYAADVYCGVPTGGAVKTIAAAFGWLSSQRVAVINISLVGPDNLILRQIVRQMIDHGFVIVAAVGNDGPAAPPLYPASYADVVGVTAVDAHQRVLLEAGRGPQVRFAAPGADMAAATLPDGYATVRGTSFAAPIVAGLLAQRMAQPDPVEAQRAVASLAREAEHRGTGSRDDAFGAGVVGADLQTAPALVRARRLGTP
jgi:subtilisin family serine protease